MIFTSESRHLKVEHLTHGDEKCELVLVDVELEEGTTAYDLQPRQDDLRHVDMTDEDVAGDLADVLQEAEIELVVLQPRDLQVAVDVRTVGVPVSKIPVMVILVRRH